MSEKIPSNEEIKIKAVHTWSKANLVHLPRAFGKNFLYKAFESILGDTIQQARAAGFREGVERAAEYLRIHEKEITSGCFSLGGWIDEIRSLRDDD